MNEESLIAKLRKLRDDSIGRQDLLSQTWDKSSPMVRKAFKNYKIVTNRLGSGYLDESDFINGYLNSCYKNAEQAAGTAISSRAVNLEGGSKTLYLCWHFRDYPTLRPILLAHKAIILVARDADWLEDLTSAGLTFNFRSGKPISKLVREMRNGTPIVAMFDYCYEETKQEIVNFLSYPVRTPIGILKLGKLFNYEIRVLGPVKKDIGTLSHFKEINNVSALATTINSEISNAILRNPTEWLMWPALDQRVVEKSG
ncbi:hypothetical protein [Variovorax sp. IB41]|uniref:hypothetical protein n=1 Tax=Variovorax sp. IB41 TaxID=2779370 RepID=UPI0018E8221C|nr:hypothetical protein [Variovorax sp. IB41]MBJ2157936.1 hypothetical protein [Variovorax sp. IB41]